MHHFNAGMRTTCSKIVSDLKLDLFTIYINFRINHIEVEAVEVIINFEKALLISFNYNATSQQLTLIYGFPGNLDTFEKTLHPYYPQFNRVYKEIIKRSNLINLDATYQDI